MVHFHIGTPVSNSNKNELSGEVLDDAWILDVREVTWTKVSHHI